jgi:hypothetical protein
MALSGGRSLWRGGWVSSAVAWGDSRGTGLVAHSQVVYVQLAQADATLEGGGSPAAR